MPYLTPDELKSLKDLQSKYNQTIFEIGIIEAQRIALKEQLEKLESNKDSLFKDLATIEQKESELTTTLQAKYGQGNIDGQTGEITPIQ